MKLGNLLERQSPENGLSITGMNGYAGEQDGSRNVITEVMRFGSRKQASERFPAAPEYVRLHWAEYRPGDGWYAVFGWNTCQPTEGDGNPLNAS